MTPRRHSLPVANFNADGKHEIVFYDYGDVNSQRVTVCVHGLTRNAHDFDALAKLLAANGRRVFTLNMAGRGESEWLKDPSGYNYAAYVADCLAFMDNFHLRKVEWIGTSMGGIIGMILAAQQPDRIKKLVLNDIGTLLTGPAFRRILDYVSTLPKSFPSRAEADAYLKKIYEPFGITDPADWETFVDASLVTDANGILRYACDPDIIVPLRVATKDFTEVSDVNLAPFWEKLDQPTLILHGAESDVLSADTVRTMKLTNPYAESVTLPGIGHAPALLSAEQTSLVLNWLNRAGSSTSMLAAGM